MFLSENKWLSLFFWQEYEMRTKPKCLDMSKFRKSLETNDYEQDSHSHSISDKLNGSFCSINTDTLSLSDPTHEYKEFRNKVKAYMEIFKEHVFDSDHPINIVANHFKIKFSAYLAEKIKELYSLRNSQEVQDFNKICNMKTNEIIKEIQKFIIKLQTCLRLMYSRTINFQYFIEEKDEVINLITNLVFKDGIIYSKLYELFEIALFDEIKVFENKLNQLKGLKPQDLGINRKFCLNDDTLLLQKTMAQEKLEQANKKKQEENEKKLKALATNDERPSLRKISELNFMVEDKNNTDNQINYIVNPIQGAKQLHINKYENFNKAEEPENPFISKVNIENEIDINANNLIEYKNKGKSKIDDQIQNLNYDLRDSVEIRYKCYILFMILL